MNATVAESQRIVNVRLEWLLLPSIAAPCLWDPERTLFRRKIKAAMINSTVAIAKKTKREKNICCILSAPWIRSSDVESLLASAAADSPGAHMQRKLDVELSFAHIPCTNWLACISTQSKRSRTYQSS